MIKFIIGGSAIFFKYKTKTFLRFDGNYYEKKEKSYMLTKLYDDDFVDFDFSNAIDEYFFSIKTEEIKYIRFSNDIFWYKVINDDLFLIENYDMLEKDFQEFTKKKKFSLKPAPM